MQERSDEQLMTAVMAGDQVALAALVTRHHAPLLGYLYRLVGGDRQLSEDLVQETLLHVLRQRTYQAARPFKPWLYTIATNLARDYFKSAAVRQCWREGDSEEASLLTRKNTPWRQSKAARCGRHSLSFVRNIASCYCSAFIKGLAYKKSLRRFTFRWVRSNRGSR
jgi:RNA polymerase sigma-70 factor, ECF subfamily